MKVCTRPKTSMCTRMDAGVGHGVGRNGNCGRVLSPLLASSVRGSSRRAQRQARPRPRGCAFCRCWRDPGGGGGGAVVRVPRSSEAARHTSPPRMSRSFVLLCCARAWGWVVPCRAECRLQRAATASLSISISLSLSLSLSTSHRTRTDVARALRGRTLVATEGADASRAPWQGGVSVLLPTLHRPR